MNSNPQTAKMLWLMFALVILIGFNVRAADQVELVKLNDTFWVHTTYFNYNNVPTPSNGLIVNTADGLILIDTPWTDGQTQELIRMTRQTFRKDIVLTVLTHAHQDRIGGLNTLLDRHIETMCTVNTAELIHAQAYGSPQIIFSENPKNISVGSVAMEIFYPGPAHTKDNIVVYFPQYQLLFGGCIIKALNATNLGNVSDGDPRMYAASVETLLTRYPDVKTVIPGHGNWGDIGLMRHTLELAKKNPK